jgi:ArsR family transcriptional regulator
MCLLPAAVDVPFPGGRSPDVVKIGPHGLYINEYCINGHCIICDATVIAFPLEFKYVTIVDISDALQTLSALAQATRLKVVVLLSENGRSGMASGDIADALDIPRHLMSAHLTVLSKAGVIASVKNGRSVVYSLDDVGILDLSLYLQRLTVAGAEQEGGNARRS